MTILKPDLLIRIEINLDKMPKQALSSHFGHDYRSFFTWSETSAFVAVCPVGKIPIFLKQQFFLLWPSYPSYLSILKQIFWPRRDVCQKSHPNQTDPDGLRHGRNYASWFRRRSSLSRLSFPRFKARPMVRTAATLQPNKIQAGQTIQGMDLKKRARLMKKEDNTIVFASHFLSRL